jgi:cation transport protein ChaC
VLRQLWDREMPSGVYDPTWLRCRGDAIGPGKTIRALAFTLPSDSPSHTGRLSDEQYRQIFSDTVGGRYGHTLDYAQKTHASLMSLGIRDRALERLLRLAPSAAPPRP